ncbi:MAG: M23 family metallopeptidase [Pseudomonadota bacterium]
MAFSYRRDPRLDLTSALFQPVWWRRLVVFAVLISAAVSALTFGVPTGEAPSLLVSDATGFDDALGTAEQDRDETATDATQIQTAFAQEHIDILTPQMHAAPATITLAPRETISDALMRSGLSAAETFAAMAPLKKVYNVRRAKPELEISAVTTGGEAPELTALTLRADFDTLVHVKRIGRRAFEAEAVQLETQRHTHIAQADIDNSLYLTAEEAEMPAATIVALIKALSYRVDFQREIRSGDGFRTLYHTSEAADGATRPGDIIYAELDLGDRVERLYQFKHPKTGRTDYFDEKGESMRRLLMRTPIDGARLTSSFGKRRHPVLGYVKSHPGVDFGARTGTPIYAAGDGVIERANRYGSYGNYIRIRHVRGFKTAYAHLSRFAKGMKAGRKVRQGQVIGYVGATGRVTGPHLHYEVIRSGKRVNPMRLDLPTGEVLSGDALAAFKVHMETVNAALLDPTPRVQMAQNGPNDQSR